MVSMLSTSTHYPTSLIPPFFIKSNFSISVEALEGGIVSRLELWGCGGGEGGQARTDVFKLAGKVKRRRRGGETSPKALLLSSKHFLVLNLNPPLSLPRVVSPDWDWFHHVMEAHCAGVFKSGLLL